MSEPLPIVSHISTAVKVDLQTFAMLLVSGKSIGQCAVRLNVPVAKLERICTLEVFRDLVRDVTKEASSDGSKDLMRSTAVDSIMKLITIRDGQQTPLALATKISMWFIDRIYGYDKRGLGERMNDLEQSLKRAGSNASIEDAVDQDIYRMFEQNPQILRRVAQMANNNQPPTAVAAGAPEPGRRGLETATSPTLPG